MVPRKSIFQCRSILMRNYQAAPGCILGRIIEHKSQKNEIRVVNFYVNGFKNKCENFFFFIK